MKPASCDGLCDMSPLLFEGTFGGKMHKAYVDSLLERLMNIMCCRVRRNYTRKREGGRREMGWRYSLARLNDMIVNGKVR